MEIIKQGLAFTKAEALALAEFAGSGDGRDEFRLVQFRSTGRLLTASVTDGARGLEVTWPIAEDQKLPELELGVDADFLEKGAKLVTSAEAQRVAFDLAQLLRSVGGLEPAKLQIVDTENTKDGIPTVIGLWSERDTITSQLTIPVKGIRDLMAPAPDSAQVARNVCLQPKYIMALGKVAAASRSASCRLHMPEGAKPVLAVFRDAGTGAEWTVVVAQFNDGAEDIPEDRHEEAVALGGLQNSLAEPEQMDPAEDTKALRMVPTEPPRGASRQRKPPASKGRKSKPAQVEG